MPTRARITSSLQLCHSFSVFRSTLRHQRSRQREHRIQRLHPFADPGGPSPAESLSASSPKHCSAISMLDSIWKLSSCPKDAEHTPERRPARRISDSNDREILALTLYYGTGFRMTFMRIGELSAKAGVNIQTIRFYERQKLVREPSRTSSGYRAYAEADLERVRFIKRCQGLGFTLREVRELIATHAPNQSSRNRDARRKKNLQITRERLRQVDEKMQLLKRIRKSLAAVVERSESPRPCEPMAECMALQEARKLEKQRACPKLPRHKKTS